MSRLPDHDLFIDENPQDTIKGLGFKDGRTAWESVQKIEKSRKTHAHKVQATIAMMQRARYHANKTKNMKTAENIYKEYLEMLKQKTKDKRTNDFEKSKQMKKKLFDKLKKRYE